MTQTLFLQESEARAVVPCSVSTQVIWLAQLKDRLQAATEKTSTIHKLLIATMDQRRKFQPIEQASLLIEVAALQSLRVPTRFLTSHRQVPQPHLHWTRIDLQFVAQVTLLDTLLTNLAEVECNLKLAKTSSIRNYLNNNRQSINTSTKNADT